MTAILPTALYYISALPYHISGHGLRAMEMPSENTMVTALMLGSSTCHMQDRLQGNIGGRRHRVLLLSWHTWKPKSIWDPIDNKCP